MAPPKAEQILSARVLDREGQPRSLGELAGGAPTLVVFLRHFG